MSRHDIHRAKGAEKVFRIDLEAGQAFTASATDYHTFTLRLVRSDQDYGERIADAYSLAARSLVANEPITLYDNAVGLAMSDGERIALYIDETGSPDALERVTVWIDRQRTAR